MGTMGRLHVGYWSREMNSEYFQRWYRHAGLCQSVRPSAAMQYRVSLVGLGRVPAQSFLLALFLKPPGNSNGHFKTLCHNGYKGGACDVQAGQV